MKFQYNLQVLISTLSLLMLTACLAPSSKKEVSHNATNTQTLDAGTSLANSYWGNFNFEDEASLMSTNSDRLFTNYLQLVSTLSPQQINSAMARMMELASQDSLSFRHFIELSDRHLYNALSPMRNDELYIPILKYIVASPKLEYIEKIRPEYQLKMATKNRIGQLAANVTLTLRDGSIVESNSLSGRFTLLVFNNPDCEDCLRIKELININKPFFEQRDVRVVSIYTDSNLELWQKSSYPDWWTDGYAAQFDVNNDALYNLKAIPTLYLLDGHKRVIFKDAPIEIIAQWLAGV